MSHQIAHSIRGRLRVRYPVPWLRARRGRVESHLRAVPGVRAVRESALTGSVRIDYDPFQVAEQGVVDALLELDAYLGSPPPAPEPEPAPRQRSRIVGKPAPLLSLLGTTSVLAVACSPAPPALIAGLVVAS
jgi:hypothetical protein